MRTTDEILDQVNDINRTIKMFTHDAPADFTVRDSTIILRKLNQIKQACFDELDQTQRSLQTIQEEF